MDISIIILNYNSKTLTLNCLKSIYESDFGSLTKEIIVVDNGSYDGIAEAVQEKFPQVIFLQNEKNLGMGGGNNAGIAKAGGRYIVIMNPDTAAKKDTFLKLYDFMQTNQRVGIAGPKQYNPDGTVQDSCYRWHNFFTPLYRRTFFGRLPWGRKDLNRFLLKDFDHNSIKKVDWLLGSFLFCRREAIKEIGMFDERFFLYFEDTDLCRRFWERGWQVVYYPPAEIIHNHARRSAEYPWYMFIRSRAAWNHIFSWLKYINKWGVGMPKYSNQL